MGEKRGVGQRRDRISGLIPNGLVGSGAKSTIKLISAVLASASLNFSLRFPTEMVFLVYKKIQVLLLQSTASMSSAHIPFSTALIFAAGAAVKTERWGYCVTAIVFLLLDPPPHSLAQPDRKTTLGWRRGWAWQGWGLRQRAFPPPPVLSVQSPLMGERENLLASGDSRVGREDGLDFLFQSVPYFLQYKRWKEKGGW